MLLGGTLVGADLDDVIVLTAAVGFLLIISLWWLYFVHSGEAGEHAFEQEAEQTKLARAGLAYAHGIMVCGAIVVAVAIEAIIAHPTDPLHLPAILIAVCGPLIFIAGNTLFRRTIGREIPLTYLLPFVALPVIGFAVHAAPASGLVLGFGIMIVMLVTALAEPKAV